MITLTSDFGLKDPYVGEMKGAILTTNPKATMIDITHDIEKFNIKMAAFTLASAAPYFPRGTVHLAVVDPGVGTERRAILIQTKRAYFVGPDNGILMLAAQSQGIDHIFELSNPNLMLPQTSNTFHGRDIFAPAAAYVDKGVKLSEFGQEIKNPVVPRFSAVQQINGALIGEAIYIDGFGNIVTNIKEKNMLDSKIVNIQLPEVSVKVKFGKAYADAEPNNLIILVGSSGFLEIAVNQGSAAGKFNVKVGDKIIFTSA
ncbi:MAG: SAM hydrolase/SAM-dependent halogenase family protein [Candidatus Bathyarchaeia archaeon]